MLFSTEGRMGEPEGVTHVLSDDLKLLISDLNKVSNADNNPELDYKVHDFNNAMSQYNCNTSALHLNISSLSKPPEGLLHS